MQPLLYHEAQIDQKPKLVFCVELRQIHVLHFICCLDKEAADLLSSVLAFYAVVVQHVRQAVHRDTDFLQVWVDELF